MEFFMELSPPLRALIAGLFTWGFTALGASGVFLAKRPGQKALDVMLGFAGGVMVAASFWSLLAPAIEISEELGYPGWLPPVAGFLAGGAALRLLDMAMPHLHPAMAETAPDGPPSSLRRTTLLVLAITLHNIPEGLAVGVAFGAMGAMPEATFAGAAALALGMEKAEPDIMRRKPRDAKAGVFAGGMGFDIAYQGLLVSLLTLASYFVGHYIESGVWEIADSPDGTTMAFVTMSMAEIFHSFNMRSQRGSIFTLHSMNKTLNWAALGSLIATTLVCEVPFIANAFDFTSVELSEYLIALCFAVSVIPIVELIKLIQRAVSRGRA